ncbi:unnamed protein product, partial [Tetraodon nigroviridis]
TKLLQKDLPANGVRNARLARMSDGRSTPWPPIFTRPFVEEEEEEEEEGHTEHPLLSQLRNFNQCQAQRWLVFYFQLKTVSHTHTQTHRDTEAVPGGRKGK